MEGEVLDKTSETSEEVSYNLLPTHSEKTMNSMKVPHAVKCITFDHSEANPGNKLDVHVPKLNENKVFVPSSLALRFDINLSGGHANNFLVKNVSSALVSQLVVKLGARPWTTLWTTTYTRYSPTYFCQWKSATTWCLRASRAKICARFAQARETKKPQELAPRKN